MDRRALPSNPAYAVSRDGRVWSRVRGGWRQLKSGGSRSEYPRVDVAGRVRLVHRLVAEAFLGPIPAGMTVNHINGRKNDPRAENLEIVSTGDNHRHAYRTGLRGAVGAKLTPQQALAARTLYREHGFRQADLCALYGVSKAAMSMLINRKSYTEKE